jgi:hypothetical protein
MSKASDAFDPLIPLERVPGPSASRVDSIVPIARFSNSAAARAEVLSRGSLQETRASEV